MSHAIICAAVNCIYMYNKQKISSQDWYTMLLVLSGHHPRRQEVSGSACAQSLVLHTRRITRNRPIVYIYDRTVIYDGFLKLGQFLWSFFTLIGCWTGTFAFVMTGQGLRILQQIREWISGSICILKSCSLCSRKTPALILEFNDMLWKMAAPRIQTGNDVISCTVHMRRMNTHTHVCPALICIWSHDPKQALWLARWPYIFQGRGRKANTFKGCGTQNAYWCKIMIIILQQNTASPLQPLGLHLWWWEIKWRLDDGWLIGILQPLSTS